MTTTSGSNVRATLTGATGAVSPGATVRLQNVSAETGAPGAGDPVVRTAGPGRLARGVRAVATVG